MGNSPGWAGNNSSWASSGWSTTALQATRFAGRPGSIELRFGTDSSIPATGFRFDQVTLTDFELFVADAQSDACVATDYIFVDDFETGDSLAWTLTQP